MNIDMGNDTKSITRRDLYIYLLVLLSMPSYIWCFLAHWCMDGHLQHEMSYSIILTKSINDLIWVFFIVAAGVFSFGSTILYKKAYFIALSLLILLRVFFSGLEVIVLIWVLIKSVVGLINAFSHRITSVRTEKIMLLIGIILPIILVCLVIARIMIHGSLAE